MLYCAALIWFNGDKNRKMEKEKKRELTLNISTDGTVEKLAPKFEHPNKLNEFLTIMGQMLEKNINRYVYASINIEVNHCVLLQ